MELNNLQKSTNNIKLETKEELLKYFNSYKWWKIIAYDDFSQNVMTEIEEKYYMKGNNKNFKVTLIVRPYLFMSIGLARKKDMSLNKFNRLLTEIGAPKEILIPSPDKDIIFPCQKGDRQAAKNAAMWLSEELEL